MRIVTWNVNGIRACAKAGFLDWVTAAIPDVLCLQEVRAEPDQLDPALCSPGGYSATWHPGQRRGYSGVATWIRSASSAEDQSTAAATTIGIGDSWFDAEGRALITDFPDFSLVNVYVPNGSRDLSRVPFKLAFYQRLHALISARHARGRHVVVCGDWNTAHTEIDLANPKANAKTTGFLPEEREWIDRFLDLGLIDVFRQHHPSEAGHYTWWSQRFGVRERNIGWRIDYFLLSKALTSRVRRVVHLTDVLGSDHCPVEVEIV